MFRSRNFGRCSMASAGLNAAGSPRLRLPRASSTPMSRQWRLDSADAPLQRLPADSSNRPNARLYSVNRSRVKTQLEHALGTRDKVAQMRRLRQVADVNQFNRTLGVDFRRMSSRSSDTRLREDRGVASASPDACDGPPSAHSSPSKRKSRQLSARSKAALQELRETDGCLRRLEQRVGEIAQLLGNSGAAHGQNVGQLKAELAQLEADANKLESKGVDSIYTSELVSGKASAKESKRGQLRRLETLFGDIEEVFHGLARNQSTTSLMA